MGDGKEPDLMENLGMSDGTEPKEIDISEPAEPRSR